MRFLLNFIAFASLMISTGLLAPVFAESAPVYDADSMQQFESSSSDQEDELPPPPAPGQERAYIPPQSATPQQGLQPEVISSSSALVPRLPSSQSSQSSQSLNQRIAHMEEQMDSLQSNSSAARIEALQKEMQSLRGQVEQLTHQIQQIQTQQKNSYTDLDKRLQQVGTQNRSSKVANADTETVTVSEDVGAGSNYKPTRKIVTSKSESTVPNQPNVAEEQQVYQTAYNLIKAKKYDEAITSLQAMLQKYPSGQFAANAHYWLGDLYNVTGKNDQALAEFSVVAKNYPESPRVSDAQLKVGLIYASQSKWPDARAAFKKVVNRYPGTASSRLASEQLKQIKQAGH